MYRFCVLLLLSGNFAIAMAQQKAVVFKASDPELQAAFDWAKQTALSYQGKPGDPVGPWYESALPPRYAFCMRDVAHQSIGGEILGMTKENKNMVTLFARNISAGKDWCSYWEINRLGNPAPEDYRNDTAFWYNLNANFDIMNACWRLYLWTGDLSYITHPVFKNFHERSVHEYIDQWVLQADSLLIRPAYPNAPAPFNEKDAFHRCRGLPSYSEGVPRLKMGIDLVAALYRSMETFADMLAATGQAKKSMMYRKKAAAYSRHIEQYWWDEKEQRYHTHMTNDGQFGKGEGETFLLWFDVLKDSVRTRRTIEHLVSKSWNVENQSYFPVVLSRYGYYDEAMKYILHLSDPGTERREYPEVSFGVLEGIVQGLMGIDADAYHNRISTLFAAGNSDTLAIENVPVLKGHISARQDATSCTLHNGTPMSFTWRVKFQGVHKFIFAGRKKIKTLQETDRRGNIISFADIQLRPGVKMQATVN